jgi:hypothetical protein
MKTTTRPTMGDVANYIVQVLLHQVDSDLCYVREGGDPIYEVYAEAMTDLAECLKGAAPFLEEFTPTDHLEARRFTNKFIASLIKEAVRRNSPHGRIPGRAAAAGPFQ